ncbi:DUF4145 domain-containing protein [Vibrio alginolyticus]|uniref:DUF4145 domain-containing protein n=1 Tax=Vibrio alginolyticus TaxID=663 RepID=UPI00215EE1F3|nr:DUF4145 domain-containing protein [Vibrio alginolyticus]MCS0179280.1 DUF4145 domain-containing protein [Vibrio alginolyticus]
MAHSWQCPYCNHNATIDGNHLSIGRHSFDHGNKFKVALMIETEVITCPNPNCCEISISAILVKKYAHIDQKPDAVLRSWQLQPNSTAKTFPDYIPKAILSDYEEACLIRDLSPKSSATLARRCLQGILRDFWEVKPARLVDEIKSIKDKIDPLTWAAIDGVRGIGNIGAHMEKDINVIVDVEPEEAALLINLLEILIKEWYINRHEREQRMQALIGVAQQKQEDRKKVTE